jgi:hypothetical protein
MKIGDEMRKLNLKMLATASVMAMSVASMASAADTYFDDSMLPSDNWNQIFQWNEQYAEGALGAAIIDATQIASIYAVEIKNAAINAGDTLYIEQSYWTDNYISSTDGDGILELGAGNGLYALTTRNDALIDGVTQVASTAFQTASVDIVTPGLSTIDLIQTVDGEGDIRDYEGVYTFGMVSSNELAAVAAFQGTAVIDGQVLDANEDLVNGVQQAIASLNTLSVTAEDNSDVTINLNDGQALDVYGVSGGYDDTYWINDDNWEQFTIESTNEALAYAPHPVIANDPAIKNLDQVAAITLNSINVGTADGDANFTIGDTYWSNGPMANADNYASQEAAFNSNYNNLSMDSNLGDAIAYDEWADANELNVRNTALATTYLDDAGELTDIGSVDNNSDLAAWANVGANLGYGYDGVGNVGLESLSQVASIGVNSIANKGTGDLILKGTENYWVGIFGEDYVADDMDFDQSVTNFTFAGEDSNAQSQYWENPTAQVNYAGALTDVGDVTLDGVDQTTSFAFNSIRSGGDIAGWTELDEGVDSELRQYSDTEVYVWGEDVGGYWVDAVQRMVGDTNEGDILAQDLSQTLALSSNTISANGSIRADIQQETDAEWDLLEGNDMDLWADTGDLTGGNLSQTISLTVNSIATRDVLDTDGTTVLSEGGDLSVAYVNQDAVNADLRDITYNEMDLEADGADTDTIDLGKLSQIAMLNMNSVDIAGDIIIGDTFGGSAGELWQQGTENDIGMNDEFGNRIYADASNGLSLGADADNTSVQAAYLNVNSVSAGGTLSGNVDQDITTDDYRSMNLVDAYSFDGLVSVANFAQVAQTNLNEVSAGVFDGAVIEQHIDTGVEITIDNTVNAISDIGSVNVEGVVQQAIARVNSISGL